MNYYLPRDKLDFEIVFAVDGEEADIWTSHVVVYKYRKSEKMPLLFYISKNGNRNGPFQNIDEVALFLAKKYLQAYDKIKEIRLSLNDCMRGSDEI